MKRKKKIKWEKGAIFSVPLLDGSFGYGQVVDFMMPTVIYCIFFSIRTSDIQFPISEINKNTAISRVAVSKEQLEYGVWGIVGESKPIFKKKLFKNEKFASAGYVGAKIFDAALAEDFLSSFHCLLPWDDWHNPDYLDKFLISIKFKPKNLLYKA